MVASEADNMVMLLRRRTRRWAHILCTRMHSTLSPQASSQTSPRHPSHAATYTNFVCSHRNAYIMCIIVTTARLFATIFMPCSQAVWWHVCVLDMPPHSLPHSNTCSQQALSQRASCVCVHTSHMSFNSPHAVRVMLWLSRTSCKKHPARRLTGRQQLPRLSRSSWRLGCEQSWRCTRTLCRQPKRRRQTWPVASRKPIHSLRFGFSLSSASLMAQGVGLPCALHLVAFQGRLSVHNRAVA